MAVVIEGFAAYALTRYRFRGAELLQSAILALRIVPVVVFMVPLYEIFVVVGQGDQLPGVTLVIPSSIYPS